ncbi:hypothetical protein DEJ32_08730 [Curtobacterium sp. MCPF17_046]|nr:hypothetical protein DEJ32_08730 [Curtobacterium sp. MCPF17_046]
MNGTGAVSVTVFVVTTGVGVGVGVWVGVGVGVLVRVGAGTALVCAGAVATAAAGRPDDGRVGCVAPKAADDPIRTTNATPAPSAAAARFRGSRSQVCRRKRTP